MSCLFLCFGQYCYVADYCLTDMSRKSFVKFFVVCPLIRCSYVQVSS